MRPFSLDDAPAVQELASAPEVAYGTLLIPHPYPDGAAADWIATHGSDDALHFAIVAKDAAVAGAITLGLERAHVRAGVGYWIGVPYWNRGYATEALRAVVAYGFDTLGLNRIYAYHFVRNAASGRVLQKAGMTHEGTLRRHTFKDGEFLDVHQYAILREEHERGH